MSAKLCHMKLTSEVKRFSNFFSWIAFLMLNMICLNFPLHLGFENIHVMFLSCMREVIGLEPGPAKTTSAVIRLPHPNQDKDSKVNDKMGKCSRVHSRTRNERTPETKIFLFLSNFGARRCIS